MKLGTYSIFPSQTIAFKRECSIKENCELYIGLKTFIEIIQLISKEKALLNRHVPCWREYFLPVMHGRCKNVKWERSN